MSNVIIKSFPQSHVDVAAALPSLHAGLDIGSSTSRRSLGERRLTKNARMIAIIAERLSSVMAFGTLEDADLYTIGQLSDYLQVSLRTLRFYEQSGLLRPHRDGMKRLYTRDDLDRLKVIVTLREMEASLTAIKTLMSTLVESGDEKSVIGEIDAMLDDLTRGNRQRIEELERVNRRIAETLGRLRAN
ncbi:MerR family transcriptional regulator [Siculibacillus lacustris]|uniref:MerR family transcriptional regulator n=1 Tax=Siculibacillus lacustris TaxID=1549641 RepID=A0A4Q9VFX6_9HYPH|nr:MerR family transcriptional regulator [Siculibacillus lacustris]TBW33871.1 MerR family transcriptional regulator [Siculibacillus lacustris]